MIYLQPQRQTNSTTSYQSLCDLSKILPPPSPPSEPVAIPHPNEARDHEEEDNNTEHTRGAVLQNSSRSHVIAPLVDSFAPDQNRSHISPNAASSHVLSSPSAHSNLPVDHPREEVSDIHENGGEQHASPK